MSDIRSADAIEFDGIAYEVEGDVAVWRGARLPHMRDQVVLITREKTGEDPYGNDVYGDIRSTLAGCSVQPRTSAETSGDRNQVITGLWLYVPADDSSYQQAALRRVRG